MSANSLTAAINRPVRLRFRPDLATSELWFGRRRFFVVKDPVALSYSYLTEHEHAILSMLDGTASTSEIQSRFSARFAPQQVTAGQLQSFFAQLHRSGLVLGEAPGQGEALASRERTKSQFNLLRLAEQLLAFRWRGVNPEPLLHWLDPKIGWFFSPAGFLLWAIVIGWATVLAITRLDEIARRLPDAAAWLAGGNLIWLGLATIGVKSLHELGHALAARRVGSRCHEIGVQLFFLLPCLYTNVSDVWLTPSKWKRIAVSAAGIYVELFLAALAMIVWWRIEPGVLSSLCLNVMLVASLGTLLLNGNPLMRYDGYYILADLVGVPNLERRSRSQLVAWLARWCAGVQWQPADELEQEPRTLLALYAAAALAYRAALLVGLYFASRAMLAPWRLEPLSDIFIAAAVIGMIVPLATSAGEFFMDARRKNELRPWRLAFSLGVIAALAAGICLVPLPQRVVAPVVIEPRDASRVYATVPGTLVHALGAGTAVEPGQIVAWLQNQELQRDLARLQSEQRQQELHLLELETLRGQDPATAAAIPATRESLADLTVRIAQVRDLLGRLELRAVHAGVILPPPNRQAKASARELTGWTGTPLDPVNLGSFIETGTLVCIIGHPGQVEALAIVEQSNAPLVQPGSAAWIAVAQSSEGALAGVVEQVARVEAGELPLHLAATGALPQAPADGGQARPLATAYHVRIKLGQPPATLLPGATGSALIAAPPQTIAARLVRWIGRTFRLRGS
jgi:putative peptide zinc metalloprotease protein